MILQSLKSLPSDVFIKFALIFAVIFGAKFVFRVVKLVLSVLRPRGGLRVSGKAVKK